MRRARRARCWSAGVRATPWSSRTTTSTPGASRTSSRARARRPTRPRGPVCSARRWPCGGDRCSRSTPDRPGPTPRPDGSASSATSPGSSSWPPGSTPARARSSYPRRSGCSRRSRCGRSAGGSSRSRSTGRTGRPTPWTRCAGRARCSPTSSVSTRVRRSARSRPRCSPSPPRSTHPRRAPDRPRRPRAAPRPARELVDREAELGQLRTCLGLALEGVPRVAVIEGPAGIGKTSLLHQVRDDARAAGVTVLSARGSQLEKEFGLGAVRQLFDPVLTDPSARSGLLTGAAVGAAQVFDATYTAVDAPTENLFTILHGLYWLTSNLASRGPLVIAVDDVQWCDTTSLRFLGYLSRRLEGLPVLLVATWRTGEQYVDDELLHELTVGPDAVTVQPAPLSAQGTAEVVRGRLDGADDAFSSACFRTTSGNPLLLRQLLRALEAEGVRPDASHADTVRAIGSRAVSSMVMMRFRRMPEGNREVARAIAVLGDGASLPMVAAMTGLSDDLTASAIASLARSEVLRPDYPLGFVHPLVEAAVYDDLPLGEREMAHDRAAHVLAVTGSSPEKVAAHLLAVPPRGDSGVVGLLREAAQRAQARGSTDSATAYLRRALLEPPGPDERPDLLLELGRLEAVVDGVAAIEHLTAAYRTHPDPTSRAEAAIMLARTAVFASDRGDATRIAHAALRGPDARPRRRAAGARRARAHLGLHARSARPRRRPGAGRGRQRPRRADPGRRPVLGGAVPRRGPRTRRRPRPLRARAPHPPGGGPRAALGGRGDGPRHERRGHHAVLGGRAPARLPHRRALRGPRRAPVARLRAVAAGRPPRRPPVDGAVHRAERAVGVQLRDRPVLRGRVHDLHAARPRVPGGGPARRGPRAGRLPDRRRRPAVHRGARQGRAHARRPRAGARHARVAGG